MISLCRPTKAQREGHHRHGCLLASHSLQRHFSKPGLILCLDCPLCSQACRLLSAPGLLAVEAWAMLPRIAVPY
jgi:hypothetical protein